MIDLVQKITLNHANIDNLQLNVMLILKVCHIAILINASNS